MTTLDSIKKIVSQSSLSLVDQLELITLFAKADNSNQSEILQLITSDNSWVERLYENYKAKESAFSVRDKKAWQSILKVEEQQLNLIGDK
jgi:hypothetical protein